MFAKLQDTIEHLVWSDHFEKLGALGRLFATMLRYLYGMLRDIFSNELTFRAMSLVYTTLLSIIPLLAVSFSLAKGLGMFDQLQTIFLQSFTQLGPDGEQIADRMLQMVNRINGRAIGAIGVVFFLWTAISMVQKVESSFNYVWYVSKPRSMARRFTEYLVVLLIGPLMMGTAFSMIASLSSNRFVAYLETLPGFAQLFLLVGKSLPYVIIIGMFTFLYLFMPNTKVSVKSALVGGIAGGVMWATVSVIFTTFIATSFRTFAVYASFGIGIIALIWLYLNWLVLLLGAQLAFYHQNPAFLRIGRQEPRLSNSMRERMALNIMTLVGQAFRVSGDNVSLKDVGARLSIPTMAIAPVAMDLEADGLLLTTETEQLVPGREVSRIGLDDILAVVRSESETGSHGDPSWSTAVGALGGDLDDAISSVVGKRTLADLLDEVENRDKG
jgi:membrane protein